MHTHTNLYIPYKPIQTTNTGNTWDITCELDRGPLRTGNLNIDEALEALHASKIELPCSVDLAIDHLGPVHPASKPFSNRKAKQAKTMDEYLHIIFVPTRFHDTFLKPLERVPGKNSCGGCKHQVHVENTHRSTVSDFRTVADQRKALKFRSNQIKIPIIKKSRDFARFVSTWPFLVAIRDFFGAAGLALIA